MIDDARRRAEEAVERCWNTAGHHPEPASCCVGCVADAVAQAGQAERVEIAHQLRLIFKDSEIFYKVREIKACLDLADALETPDGP